MSTFLRSFPLEDIAIRSGGDGRTVEAYAAVFESPTEIFDQQGHYMEQLSRSAFNKAISDAAPSGSRTGWKTKVLFNHGMTVHSTPSDKYSMPIGTPVEIRADERGLFTVTRYAKTPVADDVLELIREGAITAQSFRGRFIRSDVPAPRGGFAPDSRGDLTLVTRQEVSLMEYGPTPFPAYDDAAILGVRSELIEQIALALATRNGPDSDGSTADAAADGTSDMLAAGITDYQRLRAQAREKGAI